MVLAEKFHVVDFTSIFNSGKYIIAKADKKLHNIEK